MSLSELGGIANERDRPSPPGACGSDQSARLPGVTRAPYRPGVRLPNEAPRVDRALLRRDGDGLDPRRAPARSASGRSAGLIALGASPAPAPARWHDPSARPARPNSPQITAIYSTSF